MLVTVSPAIPTAAATAAAAAAAAAASRRSAATPRREDRIGTGGRWAVGSAECGVHASEHWASGTQPLAGRHWGRKRREKREEVLLAILTLPAWPAAVGRDTLVRHCAVSVKAIKLCRLTGSLTH